MKRLFAILLMLALLLPVMVCGEEPLPYERQAKKYIDFPTMDGWRGHFSSVTKWTIVTPETLDENWELVAARGDTEEEIRARYAQPTFLFEAYSPDLPEDACFRAEVFETEYTRDIWHLRHWDTAERKEIRNELMSGTVLTDREIYSLTNYDTNLNAYERGYFTNYPPATHESGRIRLHFYNGKLYVFSYAVSGRMAGAKRWYSAKDEAAYDKTPVYSSEAKFKGEALPRMPKYELTTTLPEVAVPGVMTFTGTAEAGAKVSAALDGQEISVTVDKKGNFTFEADLAAGEPLLTVNVEHSKYTTRVMEYPLVVSDTATPLTVTGAPETLCIIGEQALRGVTEPGASVTIVKDGDESLTIGAGEDGSFNYTFQAEERRAYSLQVTVQSAGKEATTTDFAFAADYESTEDGIKAFNEQVTDESFKTIAANVEDYIGTKVKISIKTKEVTLNEQGLGLLCSYNYNADKEKDQIKLYVNLPGYAQCQIGENMIITIYATVDGKRLIFQEDGEEEERIELTADYGTYLVYK